MGIYSYTKGIRVIEVLFLEMFTLLWNEYTGSLSVEMRKIRKQVAPRIFASFRFLLCLFCKGFRFLRYMNAALSDGAFCYIMGALSEWAWNFRHLKEIHMRYGKLKHDSHRFVWCLRDVTPIFSIFREKSIAFVIIYHCKRDFHFFSLKNFLLYLFISTPRSGQIKMKTYAQEQRERAKRMQSNSWGK